jgi:hypothetical protein
VTSGFTARSGGEETGNACALNDTMEPITLHAKTNANFFNMFYLLNDSLR